MNDLRPQLSGICAAGTTPAHSSPWQAQVIPLGVARGKTGVFGENWQPVGESNPSFQVENLAS
jgi:hypothetical protein